MRAQRSQSMVEFAIVAPLLLLLIFVMVDFGRVIYTYITLNQAVNEAVRVAIRDSPMLPTNGDVESAAKITRWMSILPIHARTGPSPQRRHHQIRVGSISRSQTRQQWSRLCRPHCRMRRAGRGGLSTTVPAARQIRPSTTLLCR